MNKRRFREIVIFTLTTAALILFGYILTDNIEIAIITTISAELGTFLGTLYYFNKYYRHGKSKK